MTTEQINSDKQGKNKDVGYCKPPVESRWKPGESGNPKGRPKDIGITSIQREMLDTPCPYSKHSPQQTWRQWLAEKGLVMASDKEMALEHLKERLEGKVDQPLSGEIILRVIDDEDALQREEKG